MGNLITKIVLTGGPCAGKTETISKIEEHLKNKGYHVLVLNECATEIINWGIRPFGDNKVEVYDFQNEILKLQMYKEKRFKEALKLYPDDTNIIILCDRGVIDNKAYLGEELFNKLLKENNLIEQDLLDEFKMVLHLRSVASGVEIGYSKANNSTRFENAEEARIVDEHTYEAWKNHPNIKTIPVQENIEDKFNLAIKYVDELLESLK